MSNLEYWRLIQDLVIEHGLTTREAWKIAEEKYKAAHGSMRFGNVRSFDSCYSRWKADRLRLLRHNP